MPVCRSLGTLSPDPWDLPLCRQNGREENSRAAAQPPRATSATESALGLRPRRAPPADFYCRQVSACAVFPLTNAPNTYASDVYSGAV